MNRKFKPSHQNKMRKKIVKIRFDECENRMKTLRKLKPLNQQEM